MPRAKIVYCVSLILLLGVWITLGRNVERFVNLVEAVPLPGVGPVARALHDSAFVVDLHADTTLLGRDFTRRSKLGHVDIPRLVEGGVGLQFFTVPTRVPLGFNINATDAEAPDLLRLIGFLQLNAFAVRGPFGRAEIQAQRLANAIERSGGQLWAVRDQAELEALIEARARGEAVVGALLGIEGAHALEGDVARLDRLFDLGYRMIGLAHFFDNAFVGSAHGSEKGGLSDEGRVLVDRMVARGMLIDLSHVSPAGVDEVLQRISVPAVFSHGGVKGTCDNLRNLSDRQIRKLAERGGVIGIGYWDTAVCGIEPAQIVAAMAYVIALVGDDYVGLGSDYDGGTTVSFDTGDLRVLTQAMVDAGFSSESIPKILGENVVRVLREVLPEGGVVSR